jgi:hypothetical protein
MGTTPVFGFPYPDPSDLVANYPALGQQLAEDVETEIIASGGLSHINTTTMSAVSSVSLNSVFSATYDNYRVIVDMVGTVGAGLDLKPRASGTDITTNLTSQRAVVDATTVSAAREATTWLARFAIGTNRSSLVLDWTAPFLAQKSNWLALNTATADIYIASGLHNAATSYDGFTFATGGGTMTGTLRVYGYKNS